MLVFNLVAPHVPISRIAIQDLLLFGTSPPCSTKFRSTLVKILPRISVGGISMVSVVVVWCLCSGRWLVGPFRTSNKLFYLTRPQLALLKSLPCSDR